MGEGTACAGAAAVGIPSFPSFEKSFSYAIIARMRSASLKRRANLATSSFVGVSAYVPLGTGLTNVAKKVVLPTVA